METFPLPAQPLDGSIECYRSRHAGGESTLTISTKLHDADAVKAFIEKAKNDLPGCSLDENREADGTKKTVIKVTSGEFSTYKFDKLEELGQQIFKNKWSNL